ncbi:MAG TPA: glycosidase [Candidatus Dormibacteraeota bacterium]|nr:glycosidase [Candidatus Dormibacteraeota bacterium]
MKDDTTKVSLTKCEEAPLISASIQRLGVVLSPNADPTEVEGVLNPACARTRNGELLLYPRDVAEGNISRIGRVRVHERNGTFDSTRDGFVLEPEEPYEVRSHPGFGCEDPRVTFIPAIDRYVMAYTAFGQAGPRIAVALSHDALAWERLGLMRFERPGMGTGDDKDAAFFPEPVLSPEGVRSLAFYHRPMLHLSAVDGLAAIPIIERLPLEDRESIRIGYIALDPVLADIKNLLDVNESAIVMSPSREWGSIKIGGGTPPIRIAEGWLSLYHAVDVLGVADNRPKFRYSAGIVIHDIERPQRVLYRSSEPLFTPESEDERNGTVDNVVFPTGIDPRPDLGERVFDVFYGMADYAIGAARMTLR